MGKRLVHIDFLKGIGIILVLLGHLPINGIIHMQIYSFHMPLFFFCSGLFFKPKTIVQGFKKDAKSILIPYVFFASILVITLIGLGCVHYKSLEVAVCQLKLNPLDSQCYPLYHTIWFLICMFFVKELLNTFSKITANYRLIGWGGVFGSYRFKRKWYSFAVFY